MFLTDIYIEISILVAIIDRIAATTRAICRRIFLYTLGQSECSFHKIRKINFHLFNADYNVLIPLRNVRVRFYKHEITDV